MKICPATPFPGRLIIKALLASVLIFSPVSTHAALSVGGLAIVGYNDTNSDNSGTDEFAMVATETITAGEVVYVTNNGWGNTNKQFFGAGSGPDVGGGVQNLVKLTFTSTIEAGTIISSADTSNSAFTWTSSGSIPMDIGSSGNFSALDLLHDDGPFTGFGDEIYIFQGSSTNPLFNVTKFIFALNIGSQFDATNWQEPPEGTRGGNLPDGTVSTNPSTFGADYIEVDTVSDLDIGDPNDNTAVALDYLSHFWGGTFGLDLSNSSVIALQNNGGTKEEWLRMINDSSHWTSTGAVFDTPLSIGVVPEPSRALTLLFGLAAGLFRRRRQKL